VAVAQVRVSFFFLLIGMFLIALVEKLMPEIHTKPLTRYIK
jgi:hypothetical protein